MRKPEINTVEVDMVPLIDIISLLLMFLIVVGDSAASASSVQMKLPRASEAKPLISEGQVVIQLVKSEGGKYRAVVNNRQYETNAGQGSLKDYLDRTLDFAIQKHMAQRNSDSTVSWPAKLRIPENCPMQDVEKVIGTLASVGMVNVQYAALPDSLR